MKEIVAIIRTNRIQRTSKALIEAGFNSVTAQEVVGRGKQRGLQHEFCHELPDPGGDVESPTVSFIPKRMLTLVVEDDQVDKLVDLIIDANRTGNVGDGKIVVMPVSGAVRVRTGESGAAALM